MKYTLAQLENEAQEIRKLADAQRAREYAESAQGIRVGS